MLIKNLVTSILSPFIRQYEEKTNVLIEMLHTLTYTNLMVDPSERKSYILKS